MAFSNDDWSLASTDDATATTAQATAQEALETAEDAMESAESVTNHFYVDEDGVHVSKDETIGSATKNILIDSNGIEIREGLETLAKFRKDGIVFSGAYLDDPYVISEIMSLVRNVRTDSSGNTLYGVDLTSSEEYISLIAPTLARIASRHVDIVANQGGINLQVVSPQGGEGRNTGITINGTLLDDWVVEAGSSDHWSWEIWNSGKKIIRYIGGYITATAWDWWNSSSYIKYVKNNNIAPKTFPNSITFNSKPMCKCTVSTAGDIGLFVVTSSNATTTQTPLWYVCSVNGGTFGSNLRIYYDIEIVGY